MSIFHQQIVVRKDKIILFNDQIVLIKDDIFQRNNELCKIYYEIV